MTAVTLQEAAESPSTTTLLAGTAATYAANANAIGEIPPTTTSASNKDPIRMIRSDFGAERRSDSEILGGSTFILQAGTTASQAGTTAVFSSFSTDNDIITTGNRGAMIPANRGCHNQSIHGEKSNETITVGNFPCGGTTAVTQCPRASTTALDSVIGSAVHDFSNILPTFDSESSGESDDDSVSDSSSSEYDCESENEDSNAYCLLNDFSAPAIDLPISREGATVEELAIPSAEEFVEAQLQDPDFINLRKWVKDHKVPTSEEIAGFGARAKEFAQISDQTQLRENILVRKRVEDPERKLILVPAGLEERIIRVIHEGVGASQQAS